MKRVLVITFVLTLSACSTTRYVPTKCVSKEQLEQIRRDEPPKVHDQLTGNAEQDIKPIAGSAVRLRAWGEGMLGILGGCVSD